MQAATPDICPPPVTAATLADFTGSPAQRRTSRDVFSTAGTQPQEISANMDHNVCTSLMCTAVLIDASFRFVARPVA